MGGPKIGLMNKTALFKDNNNSEGPLFDKKDVAYRL